MPGSGLRCERCRASEPVVKNAGLQGSRAKNVGLHGPGMKNAGLQVFKVNNPGLQDSGAKNAGLQDRNITTLSLHGYTPGLNSSGSSFLSRRQVEKGSGSGLQGESFAAHQGIQRLSSSHPSLLF